MNMQSLTAQAQKLKKDIEKNNQKLIIKNSLNKMNLFL